MRTVDEWKGALRGALAHALRERRTHTVAVLRETLAAIDNAEAVEPSDSKATEVPRRHLSPQDVSAILEREIRERQDAAATYSKLGREDEATTLKLTVEVLISLQPARAPQIDRGDVFWLPPDDSRGSVPGYSHPHVVVSDDVFNHSRITTVVVCALTTNLHRASEPGNVLLEVGEGGLAKQSVVVVSQISSVDKTQLGERIGSLAGARVDQILAGLRFQQASFFRR